MPNKRIGPALVVAAVAFLTLGAGAHADGPYGRGRMYAPPPPPFTIGGNIDGAWATSTLTALPAWQLRLQVAFLFPQK
jgi:hypothetical protein